MASLCQQCALRLRKASRSNAPTLSSRAFSQTTRTRATLPTFIESSNAELNDVLASLRQKHFIPAALHKKEKKLIFGQKFRQSLEENPRTATIGGEEITLQWMNRRTDIPNRTVLLTRAFDLIAAGESQDWQNFPAVLIAMKELCQKPVPSKLMKRMLGRSIDTGNFGIILSCLHQAERTGMVLTQAAVLRYALLGIRETARKDNWSEEKLERALKDANSLALMLESQQHQNSPKNGQERAFDPRLQPRVLGLYLELVAVHALKYEGGVDKTGIVKLYAERLLDRLDVYRTEDIHLLGVGVEWPFLQAVPIWHGLRVAQQVLGAQMPEPEKAEQAVAELGKALGRVAERLEAKQPVTGSERERALQVWQSCIN